MTLDRLKPHIVPVLLLIAATCAVYAQSLGHDFLINWDDNTYVTENEAVRGFTLGHLKAAFSSYYVGNYAPLQIISYMLDYSLWGMKAAGFIFTNILLHTLNGLLYYALLIRLTGKRRWAFAAGFIFLLHPVQVESVAWISQRKNVLAMFFFLISFLLYVEYRGRKDAGQQSKFVYGASIASFVAALLSKSVAVVLPLILVFYDLTFVPREKRGRWIGDKIPYIIVAALVAFVAMKSQVPDFGGGRTSYHGGTPLATFLTMLPVYARYLGMVFWPAGLSASYNPPIKTGVDAAVALSALLLALLFAGGVYLFRRRRDLFFWEVLFFIGFLPVSQIVPLVTLMNDRYLYFPMLGASAFIAGAAVLGISTMARASAKTATAAMVILLLPLPLLSFARAQAWQDSLTLWTDAAVKAPNREDVWRGLGDVYWRANRQEDAVRAYQRALFLNPLSRDTLLNLSALYLERKEMKKAEPHLLMLVLNNPDFAEGLVALCHYHFLNGDVREGEAACRKALMLKPRSAPVLGYLGNVHLDLKRTAEAREYYRQALEYSGGTGELHYSMALLEVTSGNNREALEHIQEALRLGYSNWSAIRTEPRLDPLRGMQEFKQLMEKHG